MRQNLKYTAAALLTAALACTSLTPAAARDGRNAAAAIGFGAGALIGAAAASAAYNGGYYYGPDYAYYGPDYVYGPGYAYDPGYAYGPDYAYDTDYAYGPGYAYEPAPYYSRSRTRVRVSDSAYRSYGSSPAGGQCWVSTDNTRGYGYYGACKSKTPDTDAATLGQARPNKGRVR